MLCSRKCGPYLENYITGRNHQPIFLPDICKGSSRNADHHGDVFDGVFLGVWATEEVAPAICVVKELGIE
jgi:hypothetical protein